MRDHRVHHEDSPWNLINEAGDFTGLELYGALSHYAHWEYLNLEGRCDRRDTMVEVARFSETR